MVVNGTTAAPGQVAMTITTNAAGVASTGENTLPYGDYIVREVSTNDSMLKTFDEEISVTISEDGQVLTYEVENEVVRGGITVTKQDSQTGTTPQGNSSFAGISFEIVNRSTNPVVVNGTTYAVGDVVMTISEYTIRTKISELQKERKALIAKVLAENDDVKYDFQFARIKQELEQLQAQLEGVQTLQKAQAVDAARMAEIAALLEKFKESDLAFDDLLVRKVVEMVKVESAEKLEIMFKDGNRRAVSLHSTREQKILFWAF